MASSLPSSALIGRVSSSVSVYGNVSRGFRSTDGLIVDPTLAPITAWAYEGGAKLDRAGASASAGLFRMDVSNEQTFNPVTLRRRTAARAGGRGWSSSGGCRWRVRRWR